MKKCKILLDKINLSQNKKVIISIKRNLRQEI